MSVWAQLNFPVEPVFMDGCLLASGCVTYCHEHGDLCADADVTHQFLVLAVTCPLILLLSVIANEMRAPLHNC